MITIEHFQGYSAMEAGLCEIADALYFMGEEPPHYPMPAITTEVSIFPDFVDVQVYERLPKWDRPYWHPVKAWHKT